LTRLEFEQFIHWLSTAPDAGKLKNYQVKKRKSERK